MFFRRTAGESGYAIMAGLDQVIDLLTICILQRRILTICVRLHLFDEDFLAYLNHFISRERFMRFRKGR